VGISPINLDQLGCKEMNWDVKDLKDHLPIVRNCQLNLPLSRKFSSVGI
jgi:hypothetical protein